MRLRQLLSTCRGTAILAHPVFRHAQWSLASCRLVDASVQGPLNAAAMLATGIKICHIGCPCLPTSCYNSFCRTCKPFQPAQPCSAGGGNHFLELVYDETGRVWVMLHSGSRNIGNITAQLYDGKAAQELEQQGITVPGGLNYLEIDSTDGRAYLGDMDWCQVGKGASLPAPLLLAAASQLKLQRGLPSTSRGSQSFCWWHSSC